MDQNYCNPELSLRLGSGYYSTAASSDSGRSSRVEDWLKDAKQHQGSQQQLTIFYNGEMSVCDATELQARAIINMAKRQMEEKISTNDRTSPMQYSRSSSFKTNIVNPQSVNTGLSMKRSLQRFLQKRKRRMDEASPYACRTPS